MAPRVSVSRTDSLVDTMYKQVTDMFVKVGIQHYERGLLWAEVYQSGHMEPEYQPRVAYRHLEWLLNRTQTL